MDAELRIGEARAGITERLSESVERSSDPQVGIVAWPRPSRLQVGSTYGLEPISVSEAIQAIRQRRIHVQLILPSLRDVRGYRERSRMLVCCCRDLLHRNDAADSDTKYRQGHHEFDDGVARGERATWTSSLRTWRQCFHRATSVRAMPFGGTTTTRVKPPLARDTDITGMPVIGASWPAARMRNRVRPIGVKQMSSVSVLSEL